MPWFAAMPLIVLACGAGACALYYAVVIYKVAFTDRTVPTLREGLREGRELLGVGGGSRDDRRWPSVCVVVPAHDEEAVIGRLVRSIAAQEYAGELRAVFVLDRCADGTERVVREAIAEAGAGASMAVIVNEACPAGWSGKTHAVHRGVRECGLATDAELLLFTDADCWFEPGCVTAAVRMLARRRLGMLSLLPTLTSERRFEKVEQPAAGLELIRQFPLGRVNRRVKPRRFANGQFMLFRRDAYEQIGGHEAVKDAVLEDLAFARRAPHCGGGVRIGVLVAAGLVRCAMYADREEFRRGWKRIYQEAAYCRPTELRGHAQRLRVVGVALPAAAVVCLGASSVAIGAADWPLARAMQICGWAGVFAFVYAIWRVYLMQGVGAVWALAYPAGAWGVASILDEAARDIEQGEPTRWAGMTYTRAPGDGGNADAGDSKNENETEGENEDVRR